MRCNTTLTKDEIARYSRQIRFSLEVVDWPTVHGEWIICMAIIMKILTLPMHGIVFLSSNPELWWELTC